VGRILKSYFFWTYERGSFHYDVMVTLILAFIFITPFVWNYGDRPQPEPLAANNILVSLPSPGVFVYDIPSSRIRRGAGPIDAQLQSEIQSVSGPVTLDRYQPLKEPHGHITAWRVWAHR
jgi:hypothetical protein